MFNLVGPTFSGQFFQKTIAPIKANLPRGRDAKPRVSPDEAMNAPAEKVWLPKAIWNRFARLTFEAAEDSQPHLYRSRVVFPIAQ